MWTQKPMITVLGSFSKHFPTFHATLCSPEVSIRRFAWGPLRMFDSAPMR